MLSFEYNGQSTTTILDTPLMIVQFDVTNDITGFSREIIKGEKTMLRQETNHYGAIYSDDSTYEFYLVKENGAGFTNEEQRKINKWLSSPTLVRPLKGIADDKEIVIYKGIFSNIGWKMITCNLGKLDAVQCTFVSDTPFIWKHYEVSGEITTNDKFTTHIFVDSDDTECKIYPKVTISSASQTKQTVTISVDGENKMSILCRPTLPICIDCKHCMVTDGTVTGLTNFEDIGWEDVGSISWLKLHDGYNTLNITGICTYKIEFDVPQKRVGDLL